MTRGYFGIGIVGSKFDVNVGQLLRSGMCFGADFLFTVGARYKNTPTDTVKAERHIPFYEYRDLRDAFSHFPHNCQPVCVELKPQAKTLSGFTHPERAVYLLGPEDGSLPDDMCLLFPTIQIDTKYCLNVAIAGSIIMYDRQFKFLSVLPHGLNEVSL
jgi:tRNA(Leu) C34 or U34 (ribose-2'-O)-methylase TrmL